MSESQFRWEFPAGDQRPALFYVSIDGVKQDLTGYTVVIDARHSYTDTQATWTKTVNATGTDVAIALGPKADADAAIPKGTYAVRVTASKAAAAGPWTRLGTITVR